MPQSTLTPEALAEAPELPARQPDAARPRLALRPVLRAPGRRREPGRRGVWIARRQRRRAPKFRGGGRMRHLPLDLGTIHFVGIGGIGMSGDRRDPAQPGLRGAGQRPQRERQRAPPAIHGRPGFRSATRPRTSEDAKVVVVSSAVQPNNAEVQSARTRLIPVVRRAEMLGELMRLKWAIAVGGTHGKTTTTSLIAALLDAAGHDPTVINGGIINAYGTNARLGEGDWMVVEADESDGSFTKLPSTIAVITNMDPEAHGLLRLGRGAARRLRGVRREHSVLMELQSCASTSRSPGPHRAHRGPPGHHLRHDPAGRCARRQRCRRGRRHALRRRDRRPHPRDEPDHRGLRAAHDGRAQRAQRAGPPSSSPTK